MSFTGNFIRTDTAQHIVDLLKNKKKVYNTNLSGYTLEDGLDLAIKIIENEYNLKEDNVQSTKG